MESADGPHPNRLVAVAVEADYGRSTLACVPSDSPEACPCSSRLASARFEVGLTGRLHFDILLFSALAMLRPWNTVFSAGTMQSFLSMNIVPKLQLYLAGMDLNPMQNTQYVEFHTTIQWMELISADIVCQILVNSFFPRVIPRGRSSEVEQTSLVVRQPVHVARSAGATHGRDQGLLPGVDGTIPRQAARHEAHSR